jgi:hypothetical protein
MPTLASNRTLSHQTNPDAPSRKAKTPDQFTYVQDGRSWTRHHADTTPPPNLGNHFANSVIDTVTGKTCKYWHLVSGSIAGHTKEVWEKSFVNELGRLARGIHTRMPDGTNTIFFIPKTQVPKDRNPAYGRIVVSIRPQETETQRT